jgi:hypothetical protein
MNAILRGDAKDRQKNLTRRRGEHGDAKRLGKRFLRVLAISCGDAKDGQKISHGDAEKTETQSVWENDFIRVLAKEAEPLQEKAFVPMNAISRGDAKDR